MRILCPKHGCQPVMQVSRDLVDDQWQVAPDAKMLTIDFVYLDTVTHRFHLSLAVASHLGFTSDTVLPLPDFFPKWTDELAWYAVCEQCFAETRTSRQAD